MKADKNRLSALLLCASRIRECEIALSQAKRPADIDFWNDESKRIEDLQELFKCSSLKEARKFLHKEVVA